MYQPEPAHGRKVPEREFHDSGFSRRSKEFYKYSFLWKTFQKFLANGFGRRNGLFFETTQSNVREPGENPGRLRHCNGYKFPKPLIRMRNGKAGMRFEAEVRIPVWLCSSGSAAFVGADFSVKEKDEASLSNGFRQDSLDAFILRFAGV